MTDLLGYAVKNIKTCQGNEGQAWSLTLYKDGKRLAVVRNDGNGGCASYDWFARPHEAWKPQSDQLDVDAETFCRNNDGWWSEFIGDDYNEYTDWFVGELMEVKECIAEAKKMLRKSFIVSKPNGGLFFWQRTGYYTTGDAVLSESDIRKSIAGTHPDGTILNDLPIEEARSFLV